jgi:hypothetical protein
MGQEARCVARIGERRAEVKALLETDELILRGEHRLRLPFATLDSVEAADGLLTLRHADETVILDLGAVAVRWAAKIRNPPTLLDKLGVKAGQEVAVVGLTDEQLCRQLRERANVFESMGIQAPSFAHDITGADFDLVFIQIETVLDLDAVPIVRTAIVQDGAVWIVHPKGRPDLKDTHIIEAGRAAGLVDNKVARISDRHSALRFVIPRAQRQAGSAARRTSG